MKKTILTVALSLSAAIFLSCANKNSNGVIVKGSLSEMDSLSYVTGLDLANSLKRDMSVISFDFNFVKKGIENAIFGEKPLIVGNDTITDESALKTLQEFFTLKLRQRMMEKNEYERALNDSTATEAPVKPEGFDFETMFASNEECALISSSIGYDIGGNMLERGVPMQLVWVLKGIDDVCNNEATMTPQEIQNYLRNYFTVIVPAENKKASEAWLKEVEKEKGVKKTESGLLYKLVKEGDMSAKPTRLEDEVEVHYKGTTRNGKVFDASRFADMPAERQNMMKQYRPNDYDKDEPVKFPLNRVIAGWGEGLQLVGKGGKIILWIPAELAYGERGAAPNIGPNEALRFEVDLLGVKHYVEDAPAEVAPAEVASAK